MRSGILRIYVKTLRLRADAPWPSQIRARWRDWLRPRSGEVESAHAADRQFPCPVFAPLTGAKQS